MTERITAAFKAIELVYGERNEQYGHPADAHARVARLWSAYLNVPIRTEDVALMMVLFKMAREMNNHMEDNLVDMHGYLLVYERILND